MTTEPGTVCGGCGRRVPHPRVETSPTSRTFSVKLPTDDHDSLKTMVDDLANGAFAELKYPRARAVEAGLVLLTHLTPDALRAVVADMAGRD